MASASSSASMLNHNSWYDVFLSFRGEDTRNSFTDHLYAALVRAGLRTFRDNDEIDRGQQLKPEIERAIRESRASIVVLSEKYANSRWCLDELLLILEQKRSFNHFVLPVFYHVDPSDVRNQRQSFTIEVDEGAEGSKWTEYKVNRWKAALTEIADLTGLVVSGPETDFIAKVVDTIDCKLDLKLVSTPAHLIGMETRAIGIESWLEKGSFGGSALAICGMGGSGKTTLAQFVYNLNKQKFESSSFLEEIGKHSKQPHGLLRLQKQLLKDIVGGKNGSVSGVSQLTHQIGKALRMKKVLIVLDDINEHEELDALIGTDEIHRKSKIIITTRLLDIHAWFGSISSRCQVHKLRLLNDHESLELLSCHAFGSKIPKEGFKELAVELAKYCGGNPLALKVLGSSLFVDAEDPQKKSSIMEIWRSTLNSLYSLEGDLDLKIQGILQRSFDSLPRASNRELFLHIAFFFVGEYEDYVVKILEHDWHAKAGIMTLINRCLLTISPSNKLMMHQLLQEMAKMIVLEESKDPAKRSRVRRNDESYHLLKKGKGSKTIEGLAFEVQKRKQRMRPSSLAVQTASLAKMDKLKLLQLKNVELTGSYKNFPELRWLCWHGCHLTTIRSGLLMSSLVAIDMSYGNLKKFEPPMVLGSLKILNLRESRKLVSIHNLSRLPNLETLIFWNCSSLTHVCQTIGSLESLALLDFTGCKNLLKALSGKKVFNEVQWFQALHIGAGIPQQLFSLPDSLKFLLLNNCDLVNNDDVPVLFSRQSLFYMNLGNNLFKALPNNINLKMLRVLELTFCPNLKSLICLPSTLEELYTYWCFSLEKITFESARFRLREFGYHGCNKVSEVQGLFKLVAVSMLDDADLGRMKWIKEYQDREVHLVGDDITKERIWDIQVLYEYGIMSTYLPRIKDQSMTTPDYISSSPFLCFPVPSCPKKRKIQGLNITSLYTSSGKNKDMRVLFTKISNTTKGLTWMYNPVVYCQPKVGEEVVWISYWPIGNILDMGDEINVSIIAGNGLIVSGCSASLVYMDDGEVELEYYKSYTKEEEVIGGDLSEFELSTGGYYLCRRDFIKSTIPDWLKVLVGDTNHCTELQGWRKCRQTQHLNASFTELETFRSYDFPNLEDDNDEDKSDEDDSEDDEVFELENGRERTEREKSLMRKGKQKRAEMKKLLGPREERRYRKVGFSTR